MQSTEFEDSLHDDSTGPEPVPARRSLLLLYVLGTTTAGIYLLRWTYLILKAQRPESAGSVRPLAASLACIAVPVRAAFLYDIYRASRERRGLSTSPASCLAPVALALGLAVAAVLSPTRNLLAVDWLLAPLPFLLVQASINREGAVATLEASTWRSLATAAAMLTCAATAAATVWLVDMPAARMLTQPVLQVGSAVRGTSELFSLEIHQAGWRRVAAGTVGDEDSDLELQATNGLSWVTAYVHPRRGLSIYDMVSSRRAMIQEGGELSSFEELRDFAPEQDLVPRSLAHYEISTPFIGGRFSVYTAETADRIVEVIAFSNAPEIDLVALVSSIQLHQGGAPE